MPGRFLGWGRKNPRTYYHGQVQDAHHTHGDFSEGDTVRVVGTNETGKVVKLVHGNFGKGRIHAQVDFGGRVQTHPLGRLRKTQGGS